MLSVFLKRAVIYFYRPIPKTLSSRMVYDAFGLWSIKKARTSKKKTPIGQIKEN
jgi:hypothetical protein